jgi:hypothetical protein
MVADFSLLISKILWIFFTIVDFWGFYFWGFYKPDYSGTNNLTQIEHKLLFEDKKRRIVT